MSKVTEVVDNYIAAWNERDSSRRSELLAKTWIESGSYIDPHRGGTGYEQLSAMIQTVHDAFPPAYRFRLKSRIDEYGDRVRFQWEAGGTKDAPLHFVGTDFALLCHDGRFQSVTGFVDESPRPRWSRPPADLRRLTPLGWTITSEVIVRLTGGLLALRAWKPIRTHRQSN